MKHFYIFIIAFWFCSFAIAGGPSIEAGSLEVGEVIITKNQIIAKVSGDFNKYISDQLVKIKLKEAILRIPKMFWSHPGGEEFLVYKDKDWSKYCSNFKSLEGRQKVFFQMWKTRLIIDGSIVTEIIADQVKFRVRKEK